MADAPKDWRVGLAVKPKAFSHPRYEGARTVAQVMPSGALIEATPTPRLLPGHGTIVDVLPDGTGWIFDRDGVLKITFPNGITILAPASDWVTA